jgi:hypothetical protein
LIINNQEFEAIILLRPPSSSVKLSSSGPEDHPVGMLQTGQ